MDLDFDKGSEVNGGKKMKASGFSMIFRTVQIVRNEDDDNSQELFRYFNTPSADMIH